MSPPTPAHVCEVPKHSLHGWLVLQEEEKLIKLIKDLNKVNKGSFFHKKQSQEGEAKCDPSHFTKF